MSITPERFLSEWTSDGSKLVKFPASALEGRGIDAASRTFLTEVGLPASAPPFLTFGPPESGKLPSVYDVVGLDPEEVEDEDDRALVKQLWVIGTDGGGDKIGLTKEGRVLVFDHAALATLPMSDSLGHLAASLLAFRAYSKGGRAEELVHKGEVDRAKERLRGIVKELRAIDAKAYDASGYWQRVLGLVLLRIGQDPAKRALAAELAEILSPPR